MKIIEPPPYRDWKDDRKMVKYFEKVLFRGLTAGFGIGLATGIVMGIVISQ